MQRWQVKSALRYYYVTEIFERSKANLAEDGKVVEVGCGPGFLASDLSLLGYKGIGADTSKEMIDIAKNQFKEINNGDWSF